MAAPTRFQKIDQLLERLRAEMEANRDSTKKLEQDVELSIKLQQDEIKNLRDGLKSYLNGGWDEGDVKTIPWVTGVVPKPWETEVVPEPRRQPPAWAAPSEDSDAMQSMKVQWSCRDHVDRITSLDFHQDWLVTACDGDKIHLYDHTDHTAPKHLCKYGTKNGVDLISFTSSSDPAVLHSSSNCWDDSLQLLSLGKEMYIRNYKGHKDTVVSLNFCSQGRSDLFVSGSLDRTVLLWDQRIQKCQGLLNVQSRPAVACDGQGVVFAVACERYVGLFDVRMHEEGPYAKFPTSDEKFTANRMMFGRDGRWLLLTTSVGDVHLFDSYNQAHIFTRRVEVSNGTLDASFTPEGRFIICGSGDGHLCALNTVDGEEAAWWPCVSKDPIVLKGAPETLVFAAGGSKNLSLWAPDWSIPD